MNEEGQHKPRPASPAGLRVTMISRGTHITPAFYQRSLIAAGHP